MRKDESKLQADALANCRTGSSAHQHKRYCPGKAVTFGQVTVNQPSVATETGLEKPETNDSEHVSKTSRWSAAESVPLMPALDLLHELVKKNPEGGFNH